MAQREYLIAVTDTFTNQKLLILSSEDHQFQIKSSVTYTGLNAMDGIQIVEIYNLKLKEIPINYLNARFRLYAGTKGSSITQIQGIDQSYLDRNIIIDGYVYDCSFDFTEMPNIKLVFKIHNNFSIQFEERVKYGNRNSYLIKKLYNDMMQISRTCNEGEDVIKFLQDTYDIFTGGSKLHNLTRDITLINNFKPLTLTVDPRKNDFINKLDDFLKFISVNVFEYPVKLVGTPSGYAISYDFFSFTNEQLDSYISKSRLMTSLSGAPKLTGSKDEEYNKQFLINQLLNYEAELYPQNYNIPNNLIIAPPVRTSTNIIQITTMLMPSIRYGDLVLLGNNLPNSNLKAGPGITGASETNSLLAYYNNYSGSFLVNKVQHKLNYAESAPANWSTVLELVQRPASTQTPYKNLYN